MQTVLEFVKANNLQHNDRVTNGKMEWVVLYQEHDYYPTPHEFYLHCTNEKGAHIGGVAVEHVAIPNLQVKPRRVRVYQFAVRLDGGKPFITEQYFPDERTATKFFADDGKVVNNVDALPSSVKDALLYPNGDVLLPDGSSMSIGETALLLAEQGVQDAS